MTKKGILQKLASFASQLLVRRYRDAETQKTLKSTLVGFAYPGPDITLKCTIIAPRSYRDAYINTRDSQVHALLALFTNIVSRRPGRKMKVLQLYCSYSFGDIGALFCGSFCVSEVCAAKEHGRHIDGSTM